MNSESGRNRNPTGPRESDLLKCSDDVADSKWFSQLASRLRAGERDVAAKLLATRPVDDELALDLVYREYLVLQELNEAPSLDEFCAKFPSYEERLRRILELDQLVGDADGDHAASGRGVSLLAAKDKTDYVGQRIGRYKILQEIGEGGFGVVYMAEQLEPVKRKVAVKVVKPGMDTRATVARFEAERQTLALLEHPNICRVLDAGSTASGHPFFVMDLIRGLPITEYCDRENLSTKERLRLFRTVCHAVQHAHNKGIIHRDLKPSNVMTTLHDGVAVPKIIDFGISKALDRQLTEKSYFTLYGQLLGTPTYMSPEQAEMSGLDIDTRSDIYSLGALLYELLTGEPPISQDRLKTAGHAELVRILRDEEPPTPSRRLNTLGESRDTVCSRRDATFPQLLQILQGDLDRIVMKAVEKDRRRRYETVADFARDIDRYLNSEPVSATAPTVAYRVRKFVTRNVGLVAAAIAVLLALTLGAGLSLVGWLRSERLREVADAATEVALQQQFRAVEETAKANQARASEHAQRLRLEENLYATEVARAHSELLADQRTAGMQALENCDPKYRDWEWHYLARRCRNFLASFSNHTNSVTGVRWSPCGKYIATSSSKWGDPRVGEVILWDAETGEAMRTLATQRGGIRNVAFSPDGKKLAAANSLGFGLTVWQVESGATLFVDGTERLYDVAFNAAGDLLAAGTVSGKVRVLKVDTGELLLELPSVSDSVYGVDFHPDRDTLAAVGHAGILTLWDARSGDLLQRINGCGNRAVRFSPDGNLIATGGYHGLKSGIVKVYHCRDGMVVASDRYITNFGAVRAVSFSPDSQYLAVASTDPVLHIWHAATGEEYRRIAAHEGSTDNVSFSPTGDRMASGGLDRQVRIWSLAPDELQLLWRQDFGYIHDLAYSPDGRRLFASGAFRTPSKRRPETIKVFAVDQLTGQWEFENSLAFSQPMLSLAVNSAGDRVLATGRAVGSAESSETGYVAAWDVESGKKLFQVAAHRGDATCCASMSDGATFITGGADGVLSHRQWEAGKLVKSWKAHPAYVRHLACNGAGQILSVGDDHRLKLWDGDTGDLIASADVSDTGPSSSDTDETAERTGALRICCHPDGRQVAVGMSSGEIQLWRIEVQRAEAATRGSLGFVQSGVLRGHQGKVTGLSFHAGGQRLASISLDQSVAIWNLKSAEAILRLTPMGQNKQLLSVKFSPSGRFLAAARGSEISVWDGAEIKQYESAMRPHTLSALSQQEMLSACEDHQNFYGVRFHCDQLLRNNPDHPGFLRTRMTASAVLNDWAAALHDLRKLRELGAWSPTDSVRLALLEIQNGNLANYQELARAAAREISDVQEPSRVHRAAWICALGADSGVDIASLIRGTEAVAMRRVARNGVLHRSSLWKALAKLYLRQGDYENSMTYVERFDHALKDPLSWLLLARAHHGLGNLDDAHHWFEKAAWSIQRRIEEKDAERWAETLELRMLRDEVAQILQLASDSEDSSNKKSAPLNSWLAMSPFQRHRVDWLRQQVDKSDDASSRLHKREYLRTLVQLQPDEVKHAVALVRTYGGDIPDSSDSELYRATLQHLADQQAGVLFGGNGDQIRTTLQLRDAAAEFTIEAWVHRDYEGPVVGLTNSRLSRSGFWLSRPSRSSSIFDCTAGGIDEQGRRRVLIPSGFRSRWNHVALVGNGEHLSLWNNGVRRFIQRCSRPLPKGDVTLFVGSLGEETMESGIGSIRQLRVSTVARYLRPFQPEAEFTVDAATLLLYDFVKDASWRETDNVIDMSSHRHDGVITDAWWSR